jgi:hypothetical protein
MSWQDLSHESHLSADRTELGIPQPRLTLPHLPTKPRIAAKNVPVRDTLLCLDTIRSTSSPTIFDAVVGLARALCARAWRAFTQGVAS